MIRRILSLAVILWALGFVWFAMALPQPAGGQKTDAIVVPTGSGGRIQRGLELLRGGAAKRMLVTGVDADVRPIEFAVEYEVPGRTMACCVTLGFAAPPRSNSRPRWIRPPLPVGTTIASVFCAPAGCGSAMANHRKPNAHRTSRSERTRRITACASAPRAR